PADRLLHEIERIAADLLHRALTLQHKAVRSFDGQFKFRPAHVVDAEAVIEKPDERADGGRGVVVLGLAEKQRRAAFNVAQIDVVAEGGALYAALAVDGKHDLRLRIVPVRDRVQPDR